MIDGAKVLMGGLFPYLYAHTHNSIAHCSGHGILLVKSVSTGSPGICVEVQKSLRGPILCVNSSCANALYTGYIISK